MLETVLAYQRAGWRVIPLHAQRAPGVCTCRKGADCGKSAAKHPLRTDWTNQPPLSAADLAEIFGAKRTPNVGLATGSASGFFVVDVDPGSGGGETMAALVAEHGPLPETYAVQTGSGGWHFYFAMPDFEVRNDQGKRLGKGVDIRGTGGQVVAPPSVSAAGPYILARRAPVLPAPEWVLERLRPAERPAVTGDVVKRDHDDPRLERYERSAVEAELARLRECSEKGWDGPPWNATTYEVACNLLELANAEWTALTYEGVEILLIEHAPRDEGFTDDDVIDRLESAQRKVDGRGRPLPPLPPRDDDLFDVAPFPPAPTAGAAEEAWRRPLIEERPWDDLGNARRLVDRYGRMVRYVPANKAWAIYDGRRWELDEGGTRVIYLIQRMLERLVEDEAQLYDDDYDPSQLTSDGLPKQGEKTERQKFVAWAKKQCMSARIEACEKQARGRQELVVEPTAFDADPMLLNCLNGVVDLRTGKRLEHDPELMLQQMAPVEYDPKAEAPGWDRFLEQVMPDIEMRAFLQRASGYSITGEISEQAMFIHQGAGANGKSQYLVAMQAVLGDYSQVVPRTTLLVGRDGIPTDIARMVGKRYMQTSETAAGRRLDEETVKSLTGGEANVARHLFGREFEFTPTGKIHYVTNHLPRLTDAESIWRRLHLFRWQVVVPEAERVDDLGRKLAESEGPGILNWLVQGCLAWQQIKLSPPQRALADLAEYRRSQDEFGEFIGEVLEPTGGGWVALDAAYAAYSRWAFSTNQGKATLRRPDFVRALTERGVSITGPVTARRVEGFTVRIEAQQPSFL